MISAFSVFPVLGSVTQAFFALMALILRLPPRFLMIFLFGSPSRVSVGKAPRSKRLFIRWARFLPPEGFFLCRSPCQTDIFCFILLS